MRAEGGPLHTRGHLPAYVDRLRATGRSHWADVLLERHAEIDVSDGIALRHLQRALEQGFTGLPVTQLPVSSSETAGQDQAASDRQRRRVDLPSAGQGSDSKYRGNEQSNMRQIRVAIGHGLSPDLHQSNHWQQHHPKPTPAGQ